VGLRLTRPRFYAQLPVGASLANNGDIVSYDFIFALRTCPERSRRGNCFILMGCGRTVQITLREPLPVNKKIRDVPTTFSTSLILAVLIYYELGNQISFTAGRLITPTRYASAIRADPTSVR